MDMLLSGFCTSLVRVDSGSSVCVCKSSPSPPVSGDEPQHPVCGHVLCVMSVLHD